MIFPGTVVDFVWSAVALGFAHDAREQRADLQGHLVRAARGDLCTHARAAPLGCALCRAKQQHLPLHELAPSGCRLFAARQRRATLTTPRESDGISGVVCFAASRSEL